MPGPALHIESLACALGGQPVLHGVSLTVPGGEVCAVLGPSGSGKSTLLRCVAGLADYQGGRVLLGGEDLGGVPVHRRGLGMVFQNYSLWPHLSVWENIALPLKTKGVKGHDLQTRVARALDMVQLADLARRRPGALSGGQKQRVAIARALAIGPRLLLLDEPLSNLDRALRQELLLQLKTLQQTLGFTTLYVTHDQQEALALGHCLAVLREGRLHAFGPPQTLKENPESLWLAAFLGELNTLTVAHCQAQGHQWRLEVAGQTLLLPAGSLAPQLVKTLAFRPAHTSLHSQGEGLAVEVLQTWPEENGHLALCAVGGAPSPALRVFSLAPPPIGPARLDITQPLYFEGT